MRGRLLIREAGLKRQSKWKQRHLGLEEEGGYNKDHDWIGYSCPRNDQRWQMEGLAKSKESRAPPSHYHCCD